MIPMEKTKKIRKMAKITQLFLTNRGIYYAFHINES
jgi:hypothetical protein